MFQNNARASASFSIIFAGVVFIADLYRPLHKSLATHALFTLAAHNLLDREAAATVCR